MVAALVFSLVLVALGLMGLAQSVRRYEESLLRSIDFSTALMQGMLSLLLLGRPRNAQSFFAALRH